MQISANYGLKLPEGTDNVKRQDFVDNFTGIDTQMKIINDNGYPNVTATGTNAYVGSTDRIKALGKGTKLTLFVSLDATGNCTLNLNSYGVKNIKDSFGNVVTNLKKDIPYNLCYNGVDFILQGKGGGGNVTPDKVLSGYTFTNDSGQGTGTMTNITTDKTASTITQSGTTVSLTVPNGYWDGTKKLNASATAIDADIVSGNIKSGANICGVAGSSTVVDTANAVLDPQYLLTGYSGYDDGVLKVGTMANMTSAVNIGGADSGDFYNSAGVCGGTATNAYVGAFDIYIPKGYYSGTGTNRLHIPNLMPWNIVNGVHVGWNGKSIVGTAPLFKTNSGTITFANSGGVTITASLIGFYPDVVIVNTTGPSEAHYLVLGRNVIINDPYIGGTTHQYARTLYGRGTVAYSDDIETPYSTGYSGYSGTFVTTWQAYKFI